MIFNKSSTYILSVFLKICIDGIPPGKYINSGTVFIYEAILLIILFTVSISYIFNSVSLI